MNNHLSEDQLTECLVRPPASGELHHIAECAECRAELERFDKTMSVFRSALRERVDVQVVFRPPAIPHTPKCAWALVAVSAMVFLMLPFFAHNIEPQRIVETGPAPMSPEELMNAVNLHISRTVPAPMERMMTVISQDESLTPSGGVQ